MKTNIALQDNMLHNNCYGCGIANDQGLQIKSYWRDDSTTECFFKAKPHHCAGPLKFLNGGVIATVIDCHSICTATANAYKNENREIGEGESIWYVTGKLDIRYLRPTIIEEEILVAAKIEEVIDKKTMISCELINHGKVCVTANVLAVRVPNDWM